MHGSEGSHNRGAYTPYPFYGGLGDVKNEKKKFCKITVNRLYLPNQMRYVHQNWTD
jgi:hypothetical protein